MVGNTIFEQNMRDMSFVSMFYKLSFCRFYNSLSTIHDFSAKFDNFAKKVKSLCDVRMVIYIINYDWCRLNRCIGANV